MCVLVGRVGGLQGLVLESVRVGGCVRRAKACAPSGRCVEQWMISMQTLRGCGVIHMCVRYCGVACDATALVCHGGCLCGV